MSPVITIVRCPRCRQPVYAAEQVLAGGKKWHSLCFNCGLCKKPLSSTTVSEHEGDIFCKQCYSRLFGVRGVGFGMGAGTLSMDTGESFRMHQDLVEQARRTLSTNLGARPTSAMTQIPNQPTMQDRRMSSGMSTQQFKQSSVMNPTAALYSQPVSARTPLSQAQRRPIQHTQQSPSQEPFESPADYELQAPAPLYRRFNNPNVNEYSAPITIASNSPEPYHQVPVVSTGGSHGPVGPSQRHAIPISGSAMAQSTQPYASSPIQSTESSIPVQLQRPSQVGGGNIRSSGRPQYPQSSF